MHAGVEDRLCGIFGSDREIDAVPNLEEVGAGHHADAHGRIADEHLLVADTFDHDEMPVVLHLDQRDAGNAGVLYLVR